MEKYSAKVKQGKGYIATILGCRLLAPSLDKPFATFFAHAGRGSFGVGMAMAIVE